MVCTLVWCEVWRVRVFLLPQPTGTWKCSQLSTGLCGHREGLLPATQVITAGGPDHQELLLWAALAPATVALASSDLRRDPLLSVSSLSICILVGLWGEG